MTKRNVMERIGRWRTVCVVADYNKEHTPQDGPSIPRIENLRWHRHGHRMRGVEYVAGQDEYRELHNYVAEKMQSLLLYYGLTDSAYEGLRRGIIQKPSKLSCLTSAICDHAIAAIFH